MSDNPILAQLEASIASEEYVAFASGKAVCNLTLSDGRTIDGNSGAATGITADEAKALARSHAISRLWAGR